MAREEKLYDCSDLPGGAFTKKQIVEMLEVKIDSSQVVLSPQGQWLDRRICFHTCRQSETRRVGRNNPTGRAGTQADD